MPGIEVDLATGVAASFAGLRRAIGAVVDNGADLGAVVARYPAEWAILTDPTIHADTALAEIAISASERRLHRESEQNFRVLQVAAIALCHGSASVGRRLVLRGVGHSDFATLRGLVRALEYARATGVGRLAVPVEDAVRVGAPHVAQADYLEERARCLQLMSLDVGLGDLVVGQRSATGASCEAVRLFELATTETMTAKERITAALDYCRKAFYEGNWEGMAVVAGSCLPVAERLSPSDISALGGSGSSDKVQAIEFEPALLRHAGDVRAYLFKVLGIQATFRERQDQAIAYFRAMRDGTGPLSPEVRAQSHLYAALTLIKRKQQTTAAVGELESGFAALSAVSEPTASIQRERGWLHNLRGLVYFRQRDMRAALDQEKAALACLEGLLDPSSIHLRVNLVSNISVLQENAGRLAQAHRTWERFAGTRFEGDEKFVKHHRYRSGGLLLKMGDQAQARVELDESLARCVALCDDFHECEIATEIGTALLDHEPAEAEKYFEQACAAAGHLGDPYRMAVAAVGRSLASGRQPDPGNRTLAARSTTHCRQVAALAQALDGDPSGCLPMPRTKLNRPFDLINL
jgi:hypothetical protein